MNRPTMKLFVLVCCGVGLIACDPPQPPDEDLGEVSENIEEARERTGDRPEGMPGEDPDQPIEGTPDAVVTALDREMMAYETRVEGADKEVAADTVAKMESLRLQLETLKRDLDAAGADTADELSAEVEKRLADVKKEWNQTKRQVDMQLDDKLEPEGGD